MVGLRVDEGVLEADVVVATLGPWSHALGRPADEAGWGVDHFPSIVGTKYHAVLMQSPRVLSQATHTRRVPNLLARARARVWGAFSRGKKHAQVAE